MKLDFMVKKTNGERILPLGMGNIEIGEPNDWEEMGDLIDELVHSLDWDKDDTLSIDLRVGAIVDEDEDEYEYEPCGVTLDEEKCSMWDEYESDDEDEAMYYEPSKRVHAICEEIGDLICDLFID